MKKALLLSALGPALFYATVSSAATTVSSFDASYTADYQWYNKSAVGGTASIESLTGKGGNLEGSAPLPTGAAKLTTGLTDDNDKGEAGIKGNFGTIGDFLNGGTLSYDYYKSSSDENKSAAAAIKLEVLDINTPQSDGYATFVFEPNWNIIPGDSIEPATDLWTNIDITGTSGTFWHSGIYGDDPQYGDGGDANTLADWVSYFGSDMLDAYIIGISVGVGSYNRGQTAYFDDVKFTSGQHDLAYDFEVSVVPLPAALPLYGAGLAALGFVAWRRKQKIASET